MKQTILYQNREIIINITPKKIKNLNIRITPLGEVFISHPLEISYDKALSLLENKFKWIVEKLDNLPPTTPAFFTEQYMFLFGEKYLIQTNLSDHNFIQIKNNNLIINSKCSLSKEERHNILQAWLKKFMIYHLNKICNAQKELFSQYHIPNFILKFRKNKRRMGTCFPYKNKIILNANLIHYPIKFIEYICVHEICHFIHPNHSKDFYALQTEIMPDWKEKAKLSKFY